MASLCKRRGKQVWRAAVMVYGTSKVKWFKDDSKKSQREAIMWEERERKQLQEQIAEQEKEKETPIPTTSCLSLIEWITQYMDDGKGRWAEKTYQEKRLVYRRFFRFQNPDMAVKDYEIGNALQYFGQQRKMRSGNALNTDRKNLGKAWNWGAKYLADQGFPTGRANPFLSVEKYPEERHARYVPPEEDFWAVYAQAEGQDRVLLIAFLHLAARRGELFRLVWEDLDFAASKIKLRTRKTRGGSWKEDYLPMTNELRQALLSHWEKRTNNSNHVFVAETTGEAYKCRQHWMKGLCASAGVKHFGMHAIRHLSAVILYKAGHPVAVIQQILRHENATTTARYLKSLGFNSEAKEALNVFEDRGAGKVLAFKKAMPSELGSEGIL